MSEEVPVQDGNDNVKEKVSTEKTDEGVDKGQSLDKIVPISLGSTHPFDDLIDNVNFDEVKYISLMDFTRCVVLLCTSLSGNFYFFKKIFRSPLPS